MKKIIYICDMCGKECKQKAALTPEENEENFKFIVPRFVKYLYLSGKIFKESYHPEETYICEDCQKELAKKFTAISKPI